MALYFGNRSFASGVSCALFLAVVFVFGAAFSGDASARGRSPRERPRPQAGAGACPGGTLPANNLGTPGNIVIDAPCKVNAGTYQFHNINIVNQGSLEFQDAKIDFWAESILIEKGGSLIAGSPDAPIGKNGGKLTIHLWGQNQGIHGTGIRCKQADCGVPNPIWISNKLSPTPNPKTCAKMTLTDGNGKTDCFYQYGTLPYDDGGGEDPGFFGYKVLAVSYGGTLELFGQKGSTLPDNLAASDSGTSWVRLNNCPNKSNAKGTGFTCVDGVLQQGATTLILSKPATTWRGESKAGARDGDMIVVTTTDYLPDHSELVQIKTISTDKTTITLDPLKPLNFRHNASVYDLIGKLPSDRVARGLTDQTQVDTRAAVALLTRSITIESGGATAMAPFPKPPAKCDFNKPEQSFFFGGHAVFRQGFKAVHIQGVEFYQLGQGGRIGHYPVHFHLARKFADDTFVKDSSAWDSMTRWYVLHTAQGVLLARNVGYRSIGHGYYIEDGTEIENKLYSNLGISALAAVDLPDNQRCIPGILAWDKVKFGPNNKTEVPLFAPFTPFHSDFEQPSVFWIMNGWNDFEYNMAVGAQACGFCYWWPPAVVSGASKYMAWEGYASEQVLGDHDGSTPLQMFLGNTCSTAMNSFNEVGDLSTCHGIGAPIPDDVHLNPIHNPLDIPEPRTTKGNDYYPTITGGFRHATICPDGADTGDCSKVKVCANGDVPTKDPNSASRNCAVSILDHYTTSFNWAEQNFAAIWLRNQWNLVINSAITDVQAGGVNFVTGGGYTRSDAAKGLWQLARKTVFIGNTQSQAANPFASNGGPINSASGLTCDDRPASINYCLNVQGGFLQQLSNFGVGQRLFSIYDGPSFEDSNAFLDITPTTISDCALTGPFGNASRCFQSSSPYGRILGIRGIFKGKGENPSGCYLPNAAIGWKQPNGFYYPPAFHSRNLFFNNVGIRHYVIEPDFKPGTLDTDANTTGAQFCNWLPNMWVSFTDVDRQTELNDDDGSLTGQIGTISVNQDRFFNSPTEATECASDIDANPLGTAKTSPYDYVSTVVYPECARTSQIDPPGPDHCKPAWGLDCGSQNCYGVPMYRLLLNPDEFASYEKAQNTLPFIRMAGQGNGQRNTLTANNGEYFIDTTIDQTTQKRTASQLNVFEPDKTYHLFLVFAKPGTTETYKIFVSKNFDLSTVKLETVNINSGQYGFTPGAWPSPQWTKTLKDGFLIVKMNMNFPAFTTDFNASISNRCQPVSFCKWDTDSKQCGCNPDSPFFDLCLGATTNDIPICHWAVKDIDCPDGGCYGFSFTLPGDFAPPPKPFLPKLFSPTPQCYPKDDNWNVKFQPADQDVAGDQCFDANPPAPGPFCSSTE